MEKRPAGGKFVGRRLLSWNLFRNEQVRRDLRLACGRGERICGGNPGDGGFSGKVT